MNELKNIFKEYYTLNDIAGILFWDNATYLPQGSSESRSEQLAVLSKLTDKGYKKVVFEGSKQAINDVKLLAQNNYCEEGEFPRQLSYLRPQ